MLLISSTLQDSCGNGGFMTSSGSRTVNAQQIENLLAAVNLPEEIGVMHQTTHTKEKTDL